MPPPKRTAATPRAFLDDIIYSAGAAEENANAAPEEARIKAVEDRLAALEPLLEQIQANSEIAVKVGEYVADLREEQVFFNKARWAIAGLSFIAILLLLTLLALALFDPASPLLDATPAVVAAFVISIVTGVILILVSFIKGVFRSTVERHADGFLPPALDAILKLSDKMNGKT